MQAPLHIPDQHPGCADLIADLKTRLLSPAGLSLDYDRDLNQARYNLKHKHGYLETKTLYETIDRLRFLPLDNHRRVDSQGGALTPRDADLQRQIANRVDRIISILETRRLMVEAPATGDVDTNSPSRPRSSSRIRDSLLSNQHLEASTAAQNTTATPVLEVLATRDIRHMAERIEGQELDRGHVLDLDGFTLEQLQPHLDALDGFSQPMTDAIQQSIQQRAQDVIALFSRQSGIISLKTHWQDQPGDVNPPSSLSAVVLSVKNRLSALDKAKDEVVLHGTTIQDKAKDFFQIIHQSVAVLWEILTEFMIRYQLEQDLTFKEYFTQVVESVALKLEILRVTMQDAVYDKDAVQQLVQVRDALENKRQALESQTRHNAMLLLQYQNAGNEFNTIVEAYADVMRRIDTVQDHIRRLE